MIASATMSLPHSRRLHGGRLVALAATLVVAACGAISTSAPPPTPADFQGLAGGIVRRGIAIDRLVSGDAGCTDAVLAPTAIAFDASGLDQADPVRLYLYVFRDRAAFERLRASIDGCARSFVTDPQTFESIESSPFVVAGQGPWASGFERALREALIEASGTGD